MTQNALPPETSLHPKRASSRATLGGSDAAALLGISPWKTPVELWLEKTGQRPVEQQDTPALEWGRRLEGVVARAAEDRLGFKLRRGGRMRRHPKHRWMTGHLDYVTADDRPPSVVEIKTALRASTAWGEPGTDQVPAHYAAQVCHYMAITQAPRAYLAVLFLTERRLATYLFKRDEAAEAALIAAEERFWTLVVKRIPPPPKNGADVESLWQSVDMAAVANAEVGAAIARLAQLRSTAAAIRAEAQELENQVQVFMGKHQRLEAPDGKLLATWREDRTGRVAWKALAEELARKYETEGWLERLAPAFTSPPPRRFVVKGEKHGNR